MVKEKNLKKIKILTWPVILILSQVFIGFITYLLLSVFIINYKSKLFNNLYILFTVIFNIIFILFLSRKKILNKQNFVKLNIKQILVIIILTILYSVIWNLIFVVKDKSSFSILIFISTCIIGPILEELVYRKLVVDMLSKNKYFISTLLFALSHLNLYKIFSAFFSGSLFYYCLLKYKSLYASIISHITYNTICYLFIAQIM